MRLVTKQEDVLPMFKQAQQEAEAAFGNGAVYIERSVGGSVHINLGLGWKQRMHLRQHPYVWPPLKLSY
jgi:pyruvate carboxylase